MKSLETVGHARARCVAGARERWDELYSTERPEPDLLGCTSLDLEGARLNDREVLRLCESIRTNATNLASLHTLRLAGIDLHFSVQLMTVEGH